MSARNFKLTAVCAVAAATPLAMSFAARAADVVIKTDATWKATGSAPASGWNTSVAFDDSTWSNAFKSPSGDNIWLTSNLSSAAPDQAWFRHVFTLDQVVSGAVGDFFFDDNGENYLNGHPIINDSGGGATNFPGVVIDPSFFVVGLNLFAIHGIDTIGPFNNVAANVQITYVPEPSSLACCAAAFGVLLPRRRARKRVSTAGRTS